MKKKSRNMHHATPASTLFEAIAAATEHSLKRENTRFTVLNAVGWIGPNTSVRVCSTDSAKGNRDDDILDSRSASVSSIFEWPDSSRIRRSGSPVGHNVDHLVSLAQLKTSNTGLMTSSSVGVDRLVVSHGFPYPCANEPRLPTTPRVEGIEQADPVTCLGFSISALISGWNHVCQPHPLLQSGAWDSRR